MVPGKRKLVSLVARRQPSDCESTTDETIEASNTNTTVSFFMRRPVARRTRSSRLAWPAAAQTLSLPEVSGATSGRGNSHGTCHWIVQPKLCWLITNTRISDRRHPDGKADDLADAGNHQGLRDNHSDNLPPGGPDQAQYGQVPAPIQR